jgi:hypothetical protein
LISAFEAYARSEFELAQKTEGMTLREHLEMAWKASGAMPARLADAPSLPMECREVWQSFLALRSSCPSSGFGPGRISFAEMDAYQRMTGDALAPWEVQAIRAADSAYMAVQAEARD